MILKAILELVSGLLSLIFSILPDIPNFDSTLLSNLDSFIDVIFSNLGVLGFFIRISTIKAVIPLLIVIINFDKIWRVVIWLFQKIPFIGH